MYLHLANDELSNQSSVLILSVSQQSHRAVINFDDELSPSGIYNGLQGAELQTSKHGGSLVNPFLVFLLNWHLLNLNLSDVSFPVSTE